MEAITYTGASGASMTLDAIDRRILHLLQQNGRMTNTAIAESVGLTATPMLQRIKKTTVRLWSDERGASLIEYSVLIGLIIAGCITAVVGVGNWTETRWNSLWGILNQTNP